MLCSARAYSRYCYFASHIGTVLIRVLLKDLNGISSFLGARLSPLRVPFFHSFDIGIGHKMWIEGEQYDVCGCGWFNLADQQHPPFFLDGFTDPIFGLHVSLELDAAFHGGAALMLTVNSAFCETYEACSVSAPCELFQFQGSNNASANILGSDGPLVVRAAVLCPPSGELCPVGLGILIHSSDLTGSSQSLSLLCSPTAPTTASYLSPVHLQVIGTLHERRPFGPDQCWSWFSFVLPSSLGCDSISKISVQAFRLAVDSGHMPVLNDCVRMLLGAVQIVPLSFYSSFIVHDPPLHRGNFHFESSFLHAQQAFRDWLASCITNLRCQAVWHVGTLEADLSCAAMYVRWSLADPRGTQHSMINFFDVFFQSCDGRENRNRSGWRFAGRTRTRCFFFERVPIANQTLLIAVRPHSKSGDVPALSACPSFSVILEHTTRSKATS